jgi:hypothetical protein
MTGPTFTVEQLISSSDELLGYPSYLAGVAFYANGNHPTDTLTAAAGFVIVEAFAGGVVPSNAVEYQRNKNQPGGYAGLDENGDLLAPIPPAASGALAIGSTVVGATVRARLTTSLTASTIGTRWRWSWTCHLKGDRNVLAVNGKVLVLVG